MSFAATLSPSPVAAAFHGIEWDPLNKLRLSEPEKATLRAAEANPLDYTLADRTEATAYARVLLKVLAETTGSGPSFRVSQVTEPLSDAEALQMLYTDASGVVTHYSIAKLYDVVVCLQEKNEKSTVSIASTFYTNDGVLMDDWRPLLRVLHLGGSGDTFAQRGAAVILANILAEGCPFKKRRARELKYSSVEEPLQALISWIASQLQSSSGASLSLVIPSLMTLMECPEARTMFRNSGGIGYLARHLNKSKRTTSSRRSRTKLDDGASVQQLYELCFCMWTLTYECHDSETVRVHFARDGAVGALVNLVSAAPREKVVRVAISALANLASCTTTNGSSGPSTSRKRVADSSYFLTEMIGCGLIKSIDRMKERQWTDPDIVEDLNLLYKLLHERCKDMCLWDVYKAEVESGHLEWGIIHSEKFFKDHAMRLEGKNGDFELVRMLVMLAAGDDEDVAAVACYDLGEFVRQYPNGRAIAKRLGAKDIVMQLIESDNEELKRHALQCVSKIMVQNWASIK